MSTGTPTAGREGGPPPPPVSVESVAKAGNPVEMARAFSLAAEAGARAYLADAIEPREMATPSTPLIGQAVLD